MTRRLPISLKIKARQSEFLKRYKKESDYSAILKDMGISRAVFSYWRKNHKSFNDKVILIFNSHYEGLLL